MSNVATTMATAKKIGLGQALHSRVKGRYAIYLRRLADGTYTVLTGWAVKEGFSRDYLSEAPVSGMEGVCHDAWERDFGRDLAAAVECFVKMKELAAEQRPLKM